MNTDCLETFITAARLGSFTAASAARHLTQPAVSRQVRRLEEDLGVKLFAQSGRNVRLTNEGTILFQHGLRILAEMENARSSLSAVGQLRGGELRIGASSTPGMYLVPGALAQFRKRYPKVAIRYQLSNSRVIEEMIVHGDLDVGFVGDPPASEHVEARAFAADRIVIVAAPDHPLAGRRSTTIEQVLAAPYVAREEGSATRRILEQWLRERRKYWTPFLELGSVEAVKQAVAAGLGLGTVSTLAVEWELHTKRLALVRVPGMKLDRDLFAVCRRTVPLSAAARVFLDLTRKRYEDV